MAGLLKKILLGLAGLVALFVIAAVGIAFLFDPNDLRERIAAEVKESTGRDLVIEGDLELSYFPWFAVNVGKTTLGNAPGFGDEPFLVFDEARLSIAVMPMLLDRRLAIGNASLDGLNMNLKVARDGRTNWQDLAEEGEDQETETESAPAALDIESVTVSNASVRYEDAQAGQRYVLTNFNLDTGRIGLQDPVDISSGFDFELQPAAISGDFSIQTSVWRDEDGGLHIGDAEFSALGVDATLQAPEEAGGSRRLAVDAFSLKTLMQRLDIEPPVTADPDALGKIIFAADVKVDDKAVAASNVDLRVDDTTFKGTLSFSRTGSGTIGIDLAGDEIDLDRYMEPAADASGGGGDTVPVEIPVDLIRAMNLRGNLRVQTATLSGIKFDNAAVGVNSADGNLRLHPITAGMFGGKYSGDVRINAAGNVPSLSVNENVTDVQLASLAKAMFDRDNITGTINGSFQLAGRGADLAAIQKSLGGEISMQLVNGTYEGTDVWYQLRRARALYKQEPAPEPRNPPRTEFSNVRAGGPVVDGVFRNNDIFAELPYMQLTGKGTVDFASTKVDYQLNARVLERPEFASGATEEELKEFTEAEIPLRITGTLIEPSIKPDVEEMLKKEVKKKVEEKIKERLLDKLLGD